VVVRIDKDYVNEMCRREKFDASYGDYVVYQHPDGYYIARLDIDTFHPLGNLVWPTDELVNHGINDAMPNSCYVERKGGTWDEANDKMCEVLQKLTIQNYQEYVTYKPVDRKPYR